MVDDFTHTFSGPFSWHSNFLSTDAIFASCQIIKMQVESKITYDRIWSRTALLGLINRKIGRKAYKDELGFRIRRCTLVELAIAASLLLSRETLLAEILPWKCINKFRDYINFRFQIQAFCWYYQNLNFFTTLISN